MLTCEVCGLPAETFGSPFALRGAGFNGEDVIVWHQRMVCVVGHHYQREVYEEEQ